MSVTGSVVSNKQHTIQDKLAQIKHQLQELKVKKDALKDPLWEKHHSPQRPHTTNQITRKKKRFIHSQLDYICAEMTFSPYMIEPTSPYPNYTVSMMNKIRDYRYGGKKFQDIPTKEIRVTDHEVKNIFVNDVLKSPDFYFPEDLEEFGHSSELAMKRSQISRLTKRTLGSANIYSKSSLFSDKSTKLKTISTTDKLKHSVSMPSNASHDVLDAFLTTVSDEEEDKNSNYTSGKSRLSKLSSLDADSLHKSKNSKHVIISSNRPSHSSKSSRKHQKDNNISLPKIASAITQSSISIASSASSIPVEVPESNPSSISPVVFHGNDSTMTIPRVETNNTLENISISNQSNSMNDNSLPPITAPENPRRSSSVSLQPPGPLSRKGSVHLDEFIMMRKQSRDISVESVILPVHVASSRRNSLTSLSAQNSVILRRGNSLSNEPSVALLEEEVLSARDGDNQIDDINSLTPNPLNEFVPDIQSNQSPSLICVDDITSVASNECIPDVQSNQSPRNADNIELIQPEITADVSNQADSSQLDNDVELSQNESSVAVTAMIDNVPAMPSQQDFMDLLSQIIDEPSPTSGAVNFQYSIELDDHISEEVVNPADLIEKVAIQEVPLQEVSSQEAQSVVQSAADIPVGEDSESSNTQLETIVDHTLPSDTIEKDPEVEYDAFFNEQNDISYNPPVNDTVNDEKQYDAINHQLENMSIDDKTAEQSTLERSQSSYSSSSSETSVTNQYSNEEFDYEDEQFEN